jgi:hypothetical protein
MNITQTTVTTLLPLLLGGIVSYFKPFLEDQKEFTNRCNRILTLSTEKIAKALNRLVDAEVRSRDFDDVVRGDGYKTPDLYDDVATMIAKHSKLSYRMCVRVQVFRLCYLLLLAGVVIGVLGLVGSLLLSAYQGVVAGVCLATATIQVGGVIVLYILTRRSEDDEEII